MHQICDPRRAATFMQLGPRRYRWEFRLHDGESDLDVPALLAPWLGDTDVRVLRSAQYTFRARIASTWRRGMVFLLGDAAHQTPPFIGRLGAGLRDAHNLAWKLAAGSPALLEVVRTRTQTTRTGPDPAGDRGGLGDDGRSGPGGGGAAGRARRGAGGCPG